MHPRAAAVVDRTGKLPLHLACETGKEWADGLSAIYEAFPDGIRQAENNPRGWLPLHMVASNANSSPGLVVKVLEAYPEGVTVADSDGNYPLHLACYSGKHWATGLEALFDAGPGVLSYSNKSGLPSFQIVALKYCTPNGSADLLQEASELETMFQLLRADPTVIA